jgi:hypothetical protein
MPNSSNTSTPQNISAKELDSLCNASLDPLFWRAERIDALSDWCGHIPFAHWIVTTATPKSIVELDTRSGVSYAAFCSAVAQRGLDTRCYTVGSRAGNQDSDQDYASLRDLNDRRFGAFSELLCMSPDEAAPRFADASIDLLHIDGRRSYEAVHHDFAQWLPRLSERSIVLFHGTNEKRGDFGIGRLWPELIRRYPSFEFLHGQGLGVLAVGAHPPDAIRQLCALDAQNIATVRNRFAMLGERWEAERRERMHRTKSTSADESQQKQTLELELRRTRTRMLSVEDARADLEAQMEQALDDAQWRASTAEDALRAIESSTFWRATRPLRSVLARMSTNGSLRAKGTRLARKLPLGLNNRARLQENVRVIANSPLFDAKWYAERYSTASEADAAHHYATTGTVERHDPGPLFDANWYLKHNPDVAAHGLNPLIHFEKFGRQEGRESRALDGKSAESAVEAARPAFPAPAADWTPEAAGVELDALLAQRFAPIAPMNIFRVAGQARAVTLIVDSVNGGPNFADPRAGLAFAVALARRINAGIRIVTRLEAADPANTEALFKAHGIEWTANIDFVYSAVKAGQAVAVGADDVFVTTTWWIAQSVLQVVEPHRIIHLLQEDERALYASGEEKMRCTETIATPGLRLIVDSQPLHAHLVAEGIVPADRPWFDPALATPGHAVPVAQPAEGKRKFVFYARPDQPRHLYWRGLEVIGKCLEDGVLDAQAWEIHFVGTGLTSLTLPGGVHPRLHQPDSCAIANSDFLRLAASADVVLCLTTSPHPGYVTLDFAATGAQVVTNRYSTKTSLDAYSPNLRCVAPSVASLEAAIGEATRSARTPPAAPRTANWNEAFASALADLGTIEAGAPRHV